MVYLIGVHHERAQRRKRGADLTDCQREFRSLVESAIQSVRPSLLAEEDHPDFLSKDGADSILLEVATAHRIENQHRFVDPNQAQREQIGYDPPRGFGPDRVPAMALEIVLHFPKREEFWVRELRDYLQRDTLFVCGWGHIESFSSLLAKEGVSVSVLANKIGACPCDIEFDREVRQYIKDNAGWLDSRKRQCFGES
jgi:hypothetical protein